MKTLSQLMTVTLDYVKNVDLTEVTYNERVRVLNVAFRERHYTCHALNISGVTLDLNSDHCLRNIEVLDGKDSWKKGTFLHIPEVTKNARPYFYNVDSYPTYDLNLKFRSTADHDILLVEFIPDKPDEIVRVGTNVVIGLTQERVLSKMWIDGIPN